MTILRLVPLALAFAVALASPAGAQNLLLNPEFDTDRSEWGDGNLSITASWQSDCDISVDVCPAMMLPSGSLKVRSTQADAGSVAGGSGSEQCVPVEADAEYVLEGFARVPSGQARTAMPDLRIVWFLGADCAGGFIQGPGTSQGSGAVGTWEFISTDATVPSTAVSANVIARPRKVEAAGAVNVLFDSLYLPEPDAALGGAAAVAALAALARRRRS